MWWRFPVLVLSALQNALLEECVVVGFVLVRLRQLGVGSPVAIGLAAVLRGSYHLYQGFGGFAGNVVMGLLFGWLYRRWGRLTPLVVTHTLLDTGAFLGFALLAGPRVLAAHLSSVGVQRRVERDAVAAPRDRLDGAGDRVAAEQHVVGAGELERLDHLAACRPGRAR